MAHLQETMDMMMKEGQLTKPERTDVLRLLATQEADIASALDKASDKKKAKLQKRLDNVKGLHQAVEQAKPVRKATCGRTVADRQQATWQTRVWG